MKKKEQDEDGRAWTVYYPNGKPEETRPLTDEEVEQIRQAVPELSEKKKITLFVYD